MNYLFQNKIILHFYYLFIILFVSSCNSTKSNIDAKDEFDSKLLYQWEFEGRQKIKYQFTQTIRTEMEIMEESSITDMVGTGNLELRIKGNKADLYLVGINMKGNMQIPDSEDMPMEEILPDTKMVTEMTETGQCKDSSEYELFAFLFPIPQKKLLPGESITVDVTFPYKLNGVINFITGTQEITLREYITLKSDSLAIIGTKINISKLPPELASNNTAIVTGTGEHIFNLTQNYFTSTIVDLTMDIKSEQYIDLMRSDTKMFSVNHYEINFLTVGKSLDD